MRRKTIGILLLALVVVAGVLFVEQNIGGRASGREPAEPAVLRVVIGGGAPRAPEVPIETPGAVPQPPAGAAPAPRPGARAPHEPPPRELRYQVRGGDTLGAITRDHLGSAAKDLVERVARRNGLSDPDNLKPGSVLLIPVERYEEHAASGRESLRDLSQRFYGAPNRVPALRRVNPDVPERDDSPIEAGRVVWIPR
ncbi:MAG: LysM peptidoglycan-binding domain-containing protein [Planctomycetes bacterium]|nr:LysM peptidoglycan-binding domain-containing protein [Planctomycetota bacterium]